MDLSTEAALSLAGAAKVDGELRNVEFVTFNNVRDPRVAAK